MGNDSNNLLFVWVCVGGRYYFMVCGCNMSELSKELQAEEQERSKKFIDQFRAEMNQKQTEGEKMSSKIPEPNFPCTALERRAFLMGYNTAINETLSVPATPPRTVSLPVEDVRMLLLFFNKDFAFGSPRTMLKYLEAVNRTRKLLEGSDG